MVFDHAREVEGLLDLLADERLDLEADDPRRLILVAVSGDGPQMTSSDIPCVRDVPASPATGLQLGRGPAVWAGCASGEARL